MSIIETSTHTVLDVVDIEGDAPVNVAVTPDGDRAYVTCENSNEVMELW